MYPELKGKNALITGATRGFGRAIAFRLAEEGVNIIVNYRRSKSEAQQVADEIIKHTDGAVSAITIRGDVGRDISLDRMFSEIEQQFDSVDILVANAAFGVPGKLMDASARHFEVTMDSSARSLHSLAVRTVPLMKNGWGRIISITSEGGMKVLPNYGVVGPAKAALESITRYLAVELAAKGIMVNGIMAGPCLTRSLAAIPGAKEILDETAEKTPMGRLISEEDVARSVAFLCSDQSSMICGQFIFVDGGISITR